MTKETKVQLGDRVKDSITGFKGIAVAITEWLHACRRITIQPETVDKESKIPDSHTFDEPQLNILKVGVKAPKPVAAKKKTGGPEIAPTPRQNVG